MATIEDVRKCLSDYSSKDPRSTIQALKRLVREPAKTAKKADPEPAEKKTTFRRKKASD